jgi:hypothetical protein
MQHCSRGALPNIEAVPLFILTVPTKLTAGSRLGAASRSSPTGLPAATTIGRNVTIGQSCLLRSTTIEDEVVVGDKCVLLEGSLVEKNAGAVVAQMQYRFNNLSHSHTSLSGRQSPAPTASGTCIWVYANAAAALSLQC